MMDEGEQNEGSAPSTPGSPDRPGDSQPVAEGQKKNVWTSGGLWIAIVVIVVLVLGYWWFSSTRGPGGLELLAPGQELTRAGEGEIIDNFPIEFILEDGMDILESYSIEYVDEGAFQPTLVYVSSRELGRSIQVYGRFFRDNQDWTIVRRADPDDPSGVTSYQATKGEDEVTITFSVDENGAVTVNIAYLDRP